MKFVELWNVMVANKYILTTYDEELATIDISDYESTIDTDLWDKEVVAVNLEEDMSVKVLVK